jgi:hypothetical protein
MSALTRPPHTPPLGFRQFVWLWNRQQRQTTPSLHREIAGWLGSRWRAGDRRLVLMVFRDAGKSTLVGLFCAWLLQRNPDLRILVLAAEHDLACKMVRNVRRVIERHPAARGLVPRRPEQWASDQFTVCRRLELRDPSLLGRGIGANLTGTRADVVVCDDVEVPNTCDSPGKREELRSRLAEVGFILVPGGLQLYVGTPHAYHSIYAAEPRPEAGEDRPFLDGFERLVIPVVDEKGRSAWPERFTPERIEELRRQAGPARFKSQMMLAPVDLSQARLDPERLRHHDLPLTFLEANGEPLLRIGERRMVAASAFWDPAFGAPQKGDASVVAALFVDEEGGFWLQGLRYLVHDPALVPQIDEATQLCRQVADFAAAHLLPSMTIETNGLGRFLPAMLRRELARRGEAMRVIEQATTSAKDRRILEAFDPVLAAGRLSVHASVLRTPFATEMRDWRPGRSGRDDGLDAVASSLLQAPMRLPRLPPRPVRDWRPSARPERARTDFTP